MSKSRTLRIVAAHAFPHIDMFGDLIHRWVQPGEVVETEKNRPSWMKEIAKGALLAADEATAKACGVKFDRQAVDAAKSAARARADESKKAHEKFLSDQKAEKVEVDKAKAEASEEVAEAAPEDTKPAPAAAPVAKKGS